jgi:hypothetical protein
MNIEANQAGGKVPFSDDSFYLSVLVKCEASKTQECYRRAFEVSITGSGTLNDVAPARIRGHNPAKNPAQLLG